ncbi:hypothetical protein [Streptomyces sp. NBC_00474]|uniref:hypothetical protein n=1 Tax=Streptomyces sp. NBC_00474 TaxID=2975754 RepID=UPI00225BAC57|nr:hypothetical protein [Streptomyces sp. NBC_00474]MCX5055059.1 hypothetical protein [Streptomyces sp. NBC_00474]
MSNGKSPYADVVVFLAVLIAGVVLVAVAHVPVGAIAEFAVGLSALYMAYRQKDDSGS